MLELRGVNEANYRRCLTCANVPRLHAVQPHRGVVCCSCGRVNSTEEPFERFALGSRRFAASGLDRQRFQVA